MPLSDRTPNDDPLPDRGRAIDIVRTLGGDAESGSRKVGVPARALADEDVATGEVDDTAVDDEGRARRYQPPV